MPRLEHDPTRGAVEAAQDVRGKKSAKIGPSTTLSLIHQPRPTGRWSDRNMARFVGLPHPIGTIDGGLPGQRTRIGVGFSPEALNRLQGIYPQAERLNALLQAMPLQKELGTDKVYSTDRRKVATGLHEISHAETILGQGGVVSLLSVLYSSDGSSGRTIGVGLTSEQFQIAAMASVVGGHNGTVSDEWQTHMIAAHGGMSVESAASGARAVRSKANPEVELRAAHMIAVLGEVDGATYAKIFQRAEIEVFIEKQLGFEKLLATLENYEHHKTEYELYKDVLDTMPTKVEIIDSPSGTEYKKYVHGVQVETLKVCSLCQGVNGHRPECRVLHNAQEITVELTDQPEFDGRRSTRTHFLHDTSPKQEEPPEQPSV